MRQGSQQPRIDIYQKGNVEKAELLFELMDEYGLRLLEWQRLVLRRWLAEKDGDFVNTDCGLAVPRQNGKGEIIVARIIYGIIFRKAQGLYTAQLQDSVEVVHRRVRDFFYENPHEEIFNLLTPRFRKKPTNYDFLEFENGAKYKFKTRIRLSGLGNTNDELINDEASEMLDSHQATLLPTVSAARTGSPQVIYAGTPPMPETVGEVFSRLRAEKLKGSKGVWTEWSTDHFTSRDDQDAWYETNPSLGYFLLPKMVETEAHSLPADDFNRMRLGWWAGVEDKRAISQASWDALAIEKPEYDDEFRPVYAVKFSPNRSDYSVAVALPLKNGKTHVEIVMNKQMGEGFAKLVKWLMERWRDSAAIIIDGQTGAPILFEELRHEGIPAKRIIMPNMREVVAAHQFMRDAIDRQELTHYDQPLLNEVVRVTKERAFGRYGGFGWESMSQNITTSALDAVTYAYWGQKIFAKKNQTDEAKKMNKERWEQVLGSL